MRLAVLTTHPVHYASALFRRIAREGDIRLTVLYGSDISVRPHVDPGFVSRIEWDVPLVEGFVSEVLPGWGGGRDPSFWWPFNPSICRRLRRDEFDCLWVHGYHRPSHWLAMGWATLLGIRVLLRDEATAISRPRGALKRWIKPLYFAVLNRMADRFLAIGSLNAGYYRQLGIPEHKIVLTPYAVDNAFFQAGAEADVSALRRELGIPEECPVILFASRMQRRKFPDQVLEAFRRLSPAAAARRPHLVFVGVGEMLEELRRAAQDLDTVRFAGFQGQAAMRRFYGLCDVFVLASIHETWGLVVNEAMNLAKPVIVSDQVGSGNDLVRHGENGFVVPVGDVGALSEALSHVLADPERARRMGLAGRAIIDRWDFEADVRGLRLALGLPTGGGEVVA